MTKKLDTRTIVNELKGNSAFFQGSDKAKPVTKKRKGPARPVKDVSDKPDTQSVDQSTNQSTDPDTSHILSRPKSFYISQKQDEDLDVLVKSIAKKIEGKMKYKVDRSTVIRLLLEKADLASDQTAIELTQYLVDQLVSQLIS